LRYSDTWRGILERVQSTRIAIRRAPVGAGTWFRTNKSRFETTSPVSPSNVAGL
jgi:hypothetical protein